MDERKNKITSKQMMVFIVSAQTGIGILSLPARLAKNAGHDGWITVIMTGTACVIISVMMVKLLKRYGDKSILSINGLLYGKHLGAIINIFLILNILFKAAINIRIFTEVIKILVLKLTPPVILTFFLMIPTVYLVWYGLKPICRFAQEMWVIMFLVLLLFLIVVRFININFLMPVGEAGLLAIIEGIPRTAYSLFGFALILIIYPEVTDKENVMKYTIWATIFTTLFYAIVVAVTTGFFGEVMVSRLVFPLFSIAMSYEAPVFERIDFFFLIVWFPAMAMAFRAYFFATYYSINKVFNIKRNTLFLILFTIILVYLSRIPRDYIQILNFMEVSDMIGIPIALAVVALDYILLFFNKKGVKRK